MLGVDWNESVHKLVDTAKILSLLRVLAFLRDRTDRLHYESYFLVD
jgi:hypothetical protein